MKDTSKAFKRKRIMSNISKSKDLYAKARKVIPGGTQLLSKRPEMFSPDKWPAYYAKAKGCNVTDIDGNEYIDMSYMGIGSCLLGYADDDVNNAVSDAVKSGSMSTLNVPEEVELAELLCEIHPWADMVRYARTGGEALSVAVRIARAASGKDVILFCGYHGWHDWYLSANLNDEKALDGHLLPGLDPLGVPRGLTKTAIPFNYNNIEEFKKLFDQYTDKIAAVVMEPVRNILPDNGFLEEIRSITKKSNVPLIFDEVSAGWRMCLGGGHLHFGIEPDIAVFAKAMSNGYPMAAVIGKKSVMSAAEKTFISSTYWTEKIGTVAALATIRKMRDCDVSTHILRIGKLIQKGWVELSKKHNIDISVKGIYGLSKFSFNKDNSLLKTFFTDSMLQKGFLGTTAFYPSFCHTRDICENYLCAVDNVFYSIKEAYLKGNINALNSGACSAAFFKRLN